MANSVNTILSNLFKEPLIYINAGAVAISMSDIETGLKILTYTVSLVTSIVLCVKYIKEIRFINHYNKNKKWPDDYDSKELF